MRWVICFVAFIAMGVFSACGSSVKVGCTTDRDCGSICVVDVQDFPGGMCTEKCLSNDECPGGTLCSDKQGGVCVRECSSQDECAAFGSGYVCKNKDDIAGRVQLMCLGQ